METFIDADRQIRGAATLTLHTPANPRMEVNTKDASWNDWFQRNGPKLLLCARQWTRSVADVEDVVQDAFVRFWRHQRQLGVDPRPLLLTSIRRAATDLARREDRRRRREEASKDDTKNPPRFFHASLEQDERTEQIERALRNLPGAQREVLVLKIWGELTFDEIARQLAISPNTAASRYRYGLGALREKLNRMTCHG